MVPCMQLRIQRFNKLIFTDYDKARMQRNWNPHTLLVEIYNDAAAVGNGGSSKLNTELAYNLSFLFLGVQRQEMKTRVHTTSCK